MGTITNILVCLHLYKIGRTKDVYMLLSWQFGLLMQIPEIMEWRNIRFNKEETFDTSILAFWLNVLQPVVAYIGVTATVGSQDIYSIIGLTMYALTFMNVKLGKSIRPRNDCPHLVFDWWPLHRAIAYHLVTLLILRRLPLRSAMIHTFVFEATFLFATLTVKPCAIASVWCWSTFVAAICVFLSVQIQTKNARSRLSSS